MVISSAEAASSASKRIGRYELLNELGRGGAGVVWRARQVDSGDIVALKSVHEGRFHHVSSIGREVRALQRISHPGIVRILDFGETGSRPWYAMELLHGRPLSSGWELASAVRSGGTKSARGAQSTLRLQPFIAAPEQNAEDEQAPTHLSELEPSRLARLLTLIRRLCTPLAFLHGEGLVHRDLKPSNIFVRNDDTPVLTDFGLAWYPRDSEGRERLDDLAGMAGTIGYMSPERIRGESEDPRSDLYSLGCILYEGVAGRPPFSGTGTAELLDKHLLATPAPLSMIVLGVPPSLENLILGLLAKNPQDRPGHASDVADVLATLGAKPWPGTSLPAPKPYLYRPSLAGRDRELAGLQAVLRQAEEGRGALTVIAGPSGIGKTALAMALSRLAWHQGWQVVTGECVPVASYAADTRAAPLHPFARLLATAVETCQRSPERAPELLGQDAGFLIPYEPTLGSLPGVHPPPEASTLPAEASQVRVIQALSGVVGRLAEHRPLLLIVDDLQWADTLSLDFLQSLGPEHFGVRGRRLAVVATLRMEEGATSLRRLLENPHARGVTLDPLSREAIADLVGAMMAQPEPPPGLIELAWRSSEGHPLLAGETVRTALEQKLLSRDEAGQWQLRTGAEGDLAGAQPQRLTTLLERRLNGLSIRARKLMQMAAVLGREVDIRLLDALANLLQAQGPGESLDELAELRAAQVLEERSRERFRFCHDRLREMAYELIPEPERPAMHRAAVAVLESREKAGADITAELATIAFHSLQAQDIPRAIDYSERAGVVALSRAANAEAARLFRQAISLAAPLPGNVADIRRARWERLAAEALDGIGDLDSAKAHLQRAAALLGWPEPTSQTRMVAGLVWQLAVQIVRRNLRGPRAFTGRDRERWEEAALVYETLVHIHYYQGASLPLMYATFLGLGLAERCPNSPMLSSAYAYGYATFNVTPFRGPAATYLKLAEQALQRRPDPAAESYARLLQAVALMAQGHLDQVDLHAKTAMKLSEPLRFHRRWEEAAAVLANTNHFHGHSDQALEWSNRTIESARQRGDGQILSWGLAVRGATYLDGGLLDEALIDLREAEPLAAAVGRNESIWVRGLLATGLLRRGAQPEALTMARAALADIRHSPPVFGGACDGYSGVCGTLLALMEVPPETEDRTIARDFEHALKALKAFSKVFPLGSPRYHLMKGRWLDLRGQVAASRASLETSLRIAGQLGLVPDQAQAQLWLGISERGSVDARRVHLSQALVLFEQCGHYHRSELIRRGLSRPVEFRPAIEARV